MILSIQPESVFLALSLKSCTVPCHFNQTVAVYTLPQPEYFSIDIGERIIAIKKPGETLFVSNSVNYIEQLDAGTASPQNRNFVEPSVNAGRRAIRRVLKA